MAGSHQHHSHPWPIKWPHHCSDSQWCAGDFVCAVLRVNVDVSLDQRRFVDTGGRAGKRSCVEARSFPSGSHRPQRRKHGGQCGHMVLGAASRLEAIQRDCLHRHFCWAHHCHHHGNPYQCHFLARRRQRPRELQGTRNSVVAKQRRYRQKQLHVHLPKGVPYPAIWCLQVQYGNRVEDHMEVQSWYRRAITEHSHRAELQRARA